jgi:hypothetical protein
LKHQTALVIDYDNDFSDRGNREPLAGILGLEVFERFAATLDYGSGHLTLSDSSTFVPPANATRLPLAFQEDMPLSDAAVDGVDGLFGIDTGNSGTPILFGPFLQRTGILRTYQGGVAGTGYGTGGSVSMLSETLNRLAFGGLTFAKLPVSFVIGQHGGSFSSTTEAGNIGYFLLAHFIPTFDYARNAMYLAPASQLPPPVYNRVGLRLNKTTHDSIDVVGVTPDGPAARAGIQTGDEIIAVDGIPATALGVGDIYSIVRRPAGVVLTFTVRRKQATLSTRVKLAVLHPPPVVSTTLSH